MASNSNSTTLYPSSGYGYTLYCGFSESSLTEEQISSNKTKINANGYIKANGTYWSTSYSSSLVLYWHDNKNNRDVEVARNTFTGFGSTSDSKSVSASFEVEHKDDGTLNGYVWIQFNKGSTTSSYAPSSGSVATDLTTLTTIPRATALANQIGTIGELMNITWTKASSSFTHKLTYEFGTLTGTIGTNLVDSASWIPLDSFYEIIKAEQKGSGKLYLTTYNGTTQIGSTQTATLTIYPNEKESNAVISEVSIRDENATTKKLTGDPSILVLTQSLAFLELTFTTRKYATVKKVTINKTEIELPTGTLLADKTTTSYIVQQDIGKATTDTFEIVITDSRGFETTKTVKNEVINYITLDVNPTFKRIQPTTGEIGLEFDGNYFNQSFGDVQNTLKISYVYKQQYEDEYSDEILLKEDTDYKITNNTFNSGNGEYKSQINLGAVFDYKKTYNFVLYVEDELTKLVINVLVVKGIPIFWWNGEKVTVNGDLYLADEDGNNPINVKNLVGGSGYDSLPVGSIINFDGDEVPAGYEEVDNIVTNGEPVKTGRKIDGKDEYVRRYVVENLKSGSTTVSANMVVSQILVTKIEGTILSNSNNWFNLDTSNFNAGYNYAYLNDVENALIIQCNTDNFKVAYVNVHYLNR